MIVKLPHWVLTDKFPAFYDTESKTAVEMVARLYAKVQEIIVDYNRFIDVINDEIETFTSGTSKDLEAFKLGIRQEFQDFIDLVELKLNDQDDEITEAVQYMKNNLSQSITNIVKQMQESGEFDQAIINAIYNSLAVQVTYQEPESLYITNALSDVVVYNEETEELVILEGDYGRKEDTVNKVQEITDSATETEYPSSKAVYNFVNDTVIEALGGEY